MPERRREATLAFLGGDGYDRAAFRERQLRWKTLYSWGRDGWTLGDPPYVTVSWRSVADVGDDTWEVLVDCEGDQDVTVHETKQAAAAAIDTTAFYYWRWRDEEWIRGIAEGDEPDRLRGPFSWERLEREKGGH